VRLLLKLLRTESKIICCPRELIYREAGKPKGSAKDFGSFGNIGTNVYTPGIANGTQGGSSGGCSRSHSGHRLSCLSTLTEEILEIACRRFGGCPCYGHPLLSKGFDSRPPPWKSTSKHLLIPIQKGYIFASLCIDYKIAPQNRIILCRASTESLQSQADVEKAHAKLETAYRQFVHVTPTRKG
jgi:hypothetical protein